MKAINYPSLQHAYCMLSICKGRFSSLTTCRNNPQAPGRCSVPKNQRRSSFALGLPRLESLGEDGLSVGFTLPETRGCFGVRDGCLGVVRCPQDTWNPTVKTMFQIHHFKIHSPKLMVSFKKWWFPIEISENPRAIFRGLC